MMHPNTRLGSVNDVIGYGVFATEFIPKGTIVWILDDLDQQLDGDYVQSLDPHRREYVKKYAYRDNQGHYVLCWDLGRFVNHSSNANCVGTAYDFDLAARDIYPGEELTCDYGCCNLDETFVCAEELGSQRTQVTSHDILNLYPQWDAIATEAMQQFHQVHQPLQHLIKREYLGKVHAVAEGRQPIDSVLRYYFDRTGTLNKTPTAV